MGESRWLLVLFFVCCFFFKKKDLLINKPKEKVAVKGGEKIKNY